MNVHDLGQGFKAVHTKDKSTGKETLTVFNTDTGFSTVLPDDSVKRLRRILEECAS